MVLVLALLIPLLTLAYETRPGTKYQVFLRNRLSTIDGELRLSNKTAFPFRSSQNQCKPTSTAQEPQTKQSIGTKGCIRRIRILLDTKHKLVTIETIHFFISWNSSSLEYIIMKRHLISYDSNEKDELNECPKTRLTILGNCQNMVGEDRDASDSERLDCKRRKLESQQDQEETSPNVEDNNDRTSKLRFLNLVSSAVSLLAEREKREQNRSQEEQARPEQTCSEVSMASTTRGSRSNSISSEHSVYRSYEMELPDQPQNECINYSILLRAPRFPTATDVPITQEIGCQLNTRRYGERPVFIDGNDDKKNQMVESSRLSQEFQIQNVVYR